MNERLRPIYERTIELLQADPRVLAAYMTGSVGTAREDAYSDVDPMFLVCADCFEALDQDLPGLFARAGVEPFVWWPERINCDTLRNYAVFFLVDAKPVQYDITIMAAPEGQSWPILHEQLIFDKAGLLQIVTPAPQQEHPPRRLRWQIEIYWIYAYIHAKYLRRGDPFRLAAAQQELLQAHVAILQALHPGTKPDWWPVMAGQLDETERSALLGYLDSPAPAAVAARLPAQMERFAADARPACARWEVAYPGAAEAIIMPYVTDVAAGLGTT
jgi:hypothetical protein